MISRSFDPALVVAARAGDAAAREELADTVVPMVLQWCARLGGPRVDAEDACHDVCIVVLTRIDRLEDPERFGTWLFGITRRVLAQHRRRAWVRKWVPGLTVEVTDHRADPGRDAEARQTTRRVHAVLESLSENEREVLVLFDLEERTESEVADLLDIPLGTARSRLRTARERFRRAAGRHLLAPPTDARIEEGGRG